MRLHLPLPRFIFHPLVAWIIALVHIYFAAKYLLLLFGGDLSWANTWKGFGALLGAYVFAALASRRKLVLGRFFHSSWAIGDRLMLPIPGFVMLPFTAFIITLVHVYLASCFLTEEAEGKMAWLFVGKGFAALTGAYVFAALAVNNFSARLQKAVAPGTNDKKNSG
jgi:hypothetical protein